MEKSDLKLLQRKFSFLLVESWLRSLKLTKLPLLSTWPNFDLEKREASGVRFIVGGTGRRASTDQGLVYQRRWCRHSSPSGSEGDLVLGRWPAGVPSRLV